MIENNALTPMPKARIAKLDLARSALAQAETVDDVKELADQAATVTEYLRRKVKERKADFAELFKWATHKLDCERDIARKFNDITRNREGRPSKKLGNVAEFNETLEDLGISQRDVSRWTLQLSVPDREYYAALASLERDQIEPTSAWLQGLANQRSGTPTHVAQNTGESEWYTPLEYITAAHKVLGEIDLDPASCEIANRTVQAKVYFDADTDGLAQEWRGKVWMNPPYTGALVSQFSEKLALAVERGDVPEAIVLVNNATETKWFARLAEVAAAYCFPTGRVRFLDPQGNPGAPLQGQAIVYVGSNPNLFIEQFRSFGWCAERVQR